MGGDSRSWEPERKRCMILPGNGSTEGEEPEVSEASTLGMRPKS
jgi:hypothetical protein